jgi:hypothetical protein
MERICLVEAGEYLLGIDVAAITRNVDSTDFVREKQEGIDVPLILLSSLLAQHSSVCFPDDFVVIGLVTGVGAQLDIVVDKIVGELEVAGRLEALPAFCSESAQQCCPQVVIYAERIVFLISPDGLDAVWKRTGADGCVAGGTGLLRDRCREKSEDTV